ncbi:hypothetical protein DFP73DRAFT_360066 [Morchella snyderi]|nr:hypothetical protein DFP73DRAFT_360066 [Morchella snyderi]
MIYPNASYLHVASKVLYSSSCPPRTRVPGYRVALCAELDRSNDVSARTRALAAPFENRTTTPGPLLWRRVVGVTAIFHCAVLRAGGLRCSGLIRAGEYLFGVCGVLVCVVHVLGFRHGFGYCQRLAS